MKPAVFSLRLISCCRSYIFLRRHSHLVYAPPTGRASATPTAIRHSHSLISRSEAITCLPGFFARLAHSGPNFGVVVGDGLAYGDEAFYGDADGLTHPRYGRGSDRLDAAAAPAAMLLYQRGDLPKKIY